MFTQFSKIPRSYLSGIISFVLFILIENRKLRSVIFEKGVRLIGTTLNHDFKIILLCIFVIIILNVMKRKIRSRFDFQNKYLLRVQLDDKDYMLDFGFFEMPISVHPRMENFDPYIMVNDGTLGKNNYLEVLQDNIEIILEIVAENPTINAFLCKYPSQTTNHHFFGIFLYQLKRSQNDHLFDNYDQSTRILSLSNLSMKYPNFARLELREFSYSFIKSAFYYDINHSDILINPDNFTHFKQFELGIHEFDIISEVMKNNLSNITTSNIRGNRLLGYSEMNLPVYIDNPRSVFYTGNSLNIPKILNNLKLEKTLILTDNKELIGEFIIQNKREYSDEETDYPIPKVVNCQEIYFNILEMLDEYPKFLRDLFEAWEDLLPDNNKQEYRRSRISPRLLSFLEQRRLFTLSDPDNDQFSGLKSLLKEKNYRESKLKSTEVVTKFQSIFEIPFFNSPSEILVASGRQKSLNSVLQDEINPDFDFIVLDLSQLKQKEIQILFVFFLILNHYKQLPGWLCISITNTDFIHPFLSRLDRSINFSRLFLHIDLIGSLSRWINSFGLYLSDPKLQNEKLRGHLFSELPKINRGLLVNYERQQYGIIDNLDLPPEYLKIPFWRRLLTIW